MYQKQMSLPVSSTSKKKIDKHIALTQSEYPSTPPPQVVSVQALQQEDESMKILNRTNFILQKFNEMGMVNSCLIDSKQFKAFSIQEVMKTTIEIFTDAIEHSQSTNFNIINYLVNYVYQKVESKTLTSQFCWSLIDQIGLEAEHKPELNFVLALMEENSYDSIEFYINLRKILFNFLFNQEKNKQGYDLFFLDDFKIICDQWINLNQRVFQTVTHQEMMEFFLEQIKSDVKKHSEQDPFYQLTCSQYMNISLLFHKYIIQKYQRYENKMEIYRKNQIIQGLKIAQKSSLDNILKQGGRDKQKFGKSFYRWGWPFFSKEDFERDILLSQQRMQYHPQFHNSSQSNICMDKPSLHSRKQGSKNSRKSIMIPMDRPKSNNQMRSSQSKQTLEQQLKTPPKKRLSISSNKGKMSTAPTNKTINYTPQTPYEQQFKQNNSHLTPNRRVSQFLDIKQLQKPSQRDQNQYYPQFGKN